MSKLQGFTLIELMIAVAIAGILAVLAVPSYQSFIVRGNRAAAQAFMMDVASREKQYLLDARSYTNDLAILYGVTVAASAIPPEVSRNYASIAIAVSATPAAFTITATPGSGSQAADGALTLDSTGAKSPDYKW